MSRFPFTHFPKGWFTVAWSSELAAGDVRPLRYFGKDLVLFRTESGEARVLAEKTAADEARRREVAEDELLLAAESRAANEKRALDAATARAESDRALAARAAERWTASSCISKVDLAGGFCLTVPPDVVVVGLAVVRLPAERSVLCACAMLPPVNTRAAASRIDMRVMIVSIPFQRPISFSGPLRGGFRGW